MRIVGIEGVRHFQLDGGVGNSCCMLVEVKSGDTFKIPIDSATYAMLAQLGDYGNNMQQAAEPIQLSPPSTPPENVGQGSSLQEFANSFITGPNQGNQMALAQELVDANNIVTSDPVAELKKIGMFGEPQDILKSLSTAGVPAGPDVVESFEDTSDQYEEDDPGEENTSIAEQY